MLNFVKNKKYLLCRPRGGLNDTLSQIKKCNDYAIKFNRILIIDTNKSGLHGQFSDYFVFTKLQNVISEVTSELITYLNILDTFPIFLKGKVDSYRSTFSRFPEFGYIEEGAKKLITFNFNEDYDEILLIHEQCGNEVSPFPLLSFIEFNHKIKSIIDEQVFKIDYPYVSIHIRNTDITTNYKLFYRILISKINLKNILICSDDSKVLRYAKNYFHGFNIFFMTDISVKISGPLHHADSYANRALLNFGVIKSLVELIAMANAESFYYTTTKDKRISGYASLAAYLCENKLILSKITGKESIRKSQGNAYFIEIYSKSEAYEKIYKLFIKTIPKPIFYFIKKIKKIFKTLTIKGP